MRGCDDCRKHGGFVVERDDPFYGPILRRCDCYKLEVAEKRILESGIAALKDKKLSNYEVFDGNTNYLLSAAKDYLKEPDGHSMMLIGSVGIGKTHLCAAVGNELLGMGREVIYFLFVSDIRKIQQVIDSQSEYDKLLKRFKECAFLIIDDLFKGSSTVSERKIIYDIVNHRYINRLPIILSSEKTLDQLLEIDEAIGSRLFEMAKGFVVTVAKGQNYRTRRNAG